MSDATLESVAIVLCDWRGHVQWSSRLSSGWKIGDYAWINLNAQSQEVAKHEFAKVVALRETRTIEVANRDGNRFRCWIWPLDSPDLAACILVRQIPGELERLSTRETKCLELLAQGIDTREMAGQLDISLSTVHTHLKRAREKLGLPNVESLISFAARHCYPQTNPLIPKHADAS
jgi:DNA-binding CsgD family transcriptional regulator